MSSLYLLLFLPIAASDSVKLDLSHPLPNDRITKIKSEFEASRKSLTKQAKESPDAIDIYSQRGDANFFLGDFKSAVADYEKMVELNKKIDRSHWRKGIAYFYAGQFKKAAHQFEIYHTFDNVDRENGIWRYLSQSKAYGRKKAREGLLKYEKDDREPFPSVYKLFAGKITGDEILKSIKSANISDTEREKRYFYAQLYIGLNYYIEGKLKKAAVHLRQATANKWGPTAGYGPRFMWHVGRLHFEQTAEQLKSKSKKAAKTKQK